MWTKYIIFTNTVHCWAESEQLRVVSRSCEGNSFTLNGFVAPLVLHWALTATGEVCMKDCRQDNFFNVLCYLAAQAFFLRERLCGHDLSGLFSLCDLRLHVTPGGRDPNSAQQDRRKGRHHTKKPPQQERKRKRRNSVTKEVNAAPVELEVL